MRVTAPSFTAGYAFADRRLRPGCIIEAPSRSGELPFMNRIAIGVLSFGFALALPRWALAQAPRTAERAKAPPSTGREPARPNPADAPPTLDPDESAEVDKYGS